MIRKTFNRVLALLLCMGMMFEGIGMQALAETTPVISDERAKVLNANNGGTPGTTDGTTDGATDDADEGDAGIIASGIYCEGVTWTLDEEGLLVVEGTAAESVGSALGQYTLGWLDRYAADIVSAKVSVKGIKNMYKFFYDCSNLKYVDFTGCDTGSVTDMSWMFRGCSNLEKLDLSAFNTGSVTDMRSMFLGCSSLSVLDLSSFDTSSVTNMSQMFSECGNLASLDLSNFDTGNVTDMQRMFWRCDNLTSLDVSHFNTGKVTKLNYMFYQCKMLSDLDVSRFETGNVTDMSWMFADCRSLKSLDLSGFDTSNVTNMSNMFYNCRNLSVLDLSSFDASKLTNSSSMLANLRVHTLKTPKNCGVTISLSGSMYDENNTSYSTIPAGVENSITLTQNDYYFDEEAEEESIVDSGTVCEGVTWTLTNKGLLTIEGTAAESVGENQIRPTGCFRERVTSVKVKVSGVKSLRYLFNDFYNLKSVDFTGSDTTETTDMRGIFANCNSLESINWAGINTSNVSDMSRMFSDCSSLKALDLSGLDTGNVTNMDGMFHGCSNLKKLDLSNFNTQKVTDMSLMFYGCDNLETLDVRSFDTGNVTNFKQMFYQCRSLLSVDVSGFNTSKATDMSWMFYECESLKCLDVSGFDTQNVTNMTSMFYGCSNVSSLDIRNFVTKNVTNMNHMFYKCIHVKELDLNHFDTANVTDMGYMFSKCQGLSNIDLKNFNTENVTDMSAMFSSCSDLTSLNIGNLNTVSVTAMSDMFANCHNLISLDLSSFNTENVTNLSNMFYNCSELKDLDLSGLDTKNVKNMSFMFSNCSALQNLDLSNFDIRNITQMTGMFVECSNLRTLDLSSFDMANITTSLYLFSNCPSLEKMKTPKNVMVSVVLPITMYDASGVEFKYLPTDNAHSVTLTSSKSSQSTKDGDDKEDVSGGDTSGGDVSGGDEGGNTPGGDEGSNTPGGDEGGNTPGGDEGDNTPGGDEGGNTPGGDEGGNTPEVPGTEDGEDDEKLFEEVIGTFKVSFVRDHKYTGKAIQPEVVVTSGNDIMKEGVDYTVSYKNNVNAATVDSAKAPTIIVKGKGNYESSVTVKFNILAVKMNSENTTVSDMIANKNGKVQTVKPVVVVNGKKLAVNKDYTIEYPDKADGAYNASGIYNILIKGIGNYQGEITTTMTILGENQVMASKLKVGKIPANVYKEGKPAMPTPEVSYKGKALELGKDYAISYKNNDRAGKATLIITGLKNAEGTYVAGSVTKTFAIKGTALSKAKAAYNNTATYIGQPICPDVVLTFETTTLRPEIDYKVTYTKNVNVGKGTIILTGCGGYAGTVKKTFTIKADTSIADKLNVSFVSGKAEASFAQKGAKPAIIVMLEDKKLVAGKDYTVSYKNNKKLAEAGADKAPTVVIKGRGNYKFTKSVSFAIIAKSLGDSDMNVKSADVFAGSKKGLLSAPVVKDGSGKKLKLNKDYKIVGYTVNGQVFDGAGEAPAGTVITVTVEGMNNYTGTISVTYRVAEKDISKTKVNKPELEYNGGKVVFTEEMLQSGKLVITDKSTGKNLVYGTDFVVVGYRNNTKKGTATATVQGIGAYGGTKDVKFKIVSKKLSSK